LARGWPDQEKETFMRMKGAAFLGLTLAASAVAMPAFAQQSQSPSVLDQARRLLGGTDDQEAQQRAYEAGRRDEQQRQMERDRDRRTGDYEARRGYDGQRGNDDRRSYRSGSDPSGGAAPGYSDGQYRDRGQATSPYDRSDRNNDPSYRR